MKLQAGIVSCVSYKLSIKMLKILRGVINQFLIEPQKEPHILTLLSPFQPLFYSFKECLPSETR